MGARKIKLLLAYYLFTFALVGCMTLESDALAQSLLKGATPSSYTIPAGWQLYATQNFESGSLSGPNEFVNGGAAITTAQVHSGTRSVGGPINGHQNPGWGFEIFPGREFYISFWEYLDSNARFNTEMFLLDFKQNSVNQHIVLDWYWPSFAQYNSTVARLTLTSEGPGKDKANYGFDYTVPVGSWHQWEMRFKPNAPGLVDGQVTVYLNGALFSTWGPIDLNGTIDMAGSRLMVGATYTKQVWAWHNPDGSIQRCGTFESDGDAPFIQCYDFTNCFCPPNPPIFNRYFDDIIVLIRSGTADTTLPNPPFGLTVK